MILDRTQMRKTADKVEALHRRSVELASDNLQKSYEIERLQKIGARWRERWAWTAGFFLAMVAWEIWSRVIRWALN